MTSSGESMTLYSGSSSLFIMPLEVLPVRSKEKYLRHYEDFNNFVKEYPFEASLDVIIIDYIQSLREQGLKISTIRSYISAITTCLTNEDKVLDPNTHKKIQLFFQQQGKREEPKQSSVFTAEEIQTFLGFPPSLSNLQLKVAAIFGLYCAFRISELHSITLNSFKEDNTKGCYHVLLASSKTNPSADYMFIPYMDGNINLKEIICSYISHLTAYLNCQSEVKYADCFWRCIRNERFINSAIGINTLGKMPSRIASLLKLPNPSSYTGHSFRRTAASCMAAKGSSEEEIMAIGRWQSGQIAHHYVEMSGNARWKAVQGMISGCTTPALPMREPQQTAPVNETNDLLRCIFHNCSIQNVSINITSKSETTISPVKRPRNQVSSNPNNYMIPPVAIPEMDITRRKIAMEVY